MAKKKPKQKKEKKRDYLVITVSAFIGFLFILGIFGNRGVMENYKLSKQNDIIKEDISSLKAENKKLGLEIDNLKGNMRYIEKLAREEFNMSRPNEITFIFKEEKPKPRKAKKD